MQRKTPFNYTDKIDYRIFKKCILWFITITFSFPFFVVIVTNYSANNKNYAKNSLNKKSCFSTAWQYLRLSKTELKTFVIFIVLVANFQSLLCVCNRREDYATVEICTLLQSSRFIGLQIQDSVFIYFTYLKTTISSTIKNTMYLVQEENSLN